MEWVGCHMLMLLWKWMCKLLGLWMMNELGRGFGMMSRGDKWQAVVGCLTIEGEGREREKTKGRNISKAVLARDCVNAIETS